MPIKSGYSTKSVIAVKLINGNMNDAETGERENHAAAIAAVVSKEIVGKAEFKLFRACELYL